MAMSIDFRQLDHFLNTMKITEKQYNDFLYSFLLDMGYRVIGDAKKNTPVDTGALRSSWGIKTKSENPKQVKLYSTKSGHYINKTLYDRVGKVVRDGFGKTMSIILNNPQDYATQIEDGFMKTNNEWYQGQYMLKKALEKNKIERVKLYDLKFNDFKVRMGL